MMKKVVKNSIIFLLILFLFWAGAVQGITNIDKSPEHNYLSLQDLGEDILVNTTTTKSSSDHKYIIPNSRGDYIDQEQALDFGGGLNVNYGQYVAQSFKPSVTRLSKVQLKLFKYNGEPTYDLVFSVRDDLNGNDLVTVVKSPGEIYNGWNELDFADLETTIDQPYYLVCQGDGGYEDDPIYCWYCTDTNPYDRGMVSVFNWGRWHSVPGVDCCFKTVYTNFLPYIPSINGTTNGKIEVSYTYSASSTDPDDDQLYYLFDWGDNQTSGFLGPYNSGDSANSSHSWDERGTYIIKVKAIDTCNGESDWVELEVTMPTDQQSLYPLSYRLFRRLPLLDKLPLGLFYKNLCILSFIETVGGEK